MRTGKATLLNVFQHRALFRKLLIQPCRLKEYLRLAPVQAYYTHKPKKSVKTTTTRYTVPPVPSTLASLENLLVEYVYDTQTQRRVRLRTADWSVSPFGCRYVLRDQERWVLNLIRNADAVVVSCYVLSRRPLFEALAQKERVLMLCHKTDMAGPADARNAKPFVQRVRALQGREFAPSELAPAAPWFQHCVPVKKVPVARCLGDFQSDRTVPLMHDKTIVALRKSTDAQTYYPYALWTGTNNFTENATRSVGVGMIVDHPETAAMRLNDILNYVLSSEPVPWCHQALTPEWREKA